MGWMVVARLFWTSRCVVDGWLARHARSRRRAVMTAATLILGGGIWIWVDASAGCGCAGVGWPVQLME